jgi:hypothetical protein
MKVKPRGEIRLNVWPPIPSAIFSRTDAFTGKRFLEALFPGFK